MAYFILVPEEITDFIVFCVCSGSFTLLLLFAISGIIIMINRMFSRKKSQMSGRTIQLHKSLLRSLIVQTCVPSLFLCLPLVLLVVVSTIQSATGDITTPFYVYLGIAPVAPLFACYSPAQIITMITVTKPYRKAVVEFMCQTMKLKRKVVPQKFRTVSSFNKATVTNHSYLPQRRCH
ncbi:hypothetical protein Y032_0009g425 [Ancylostoma ceylanicum]|nr:hypothetical protein Y032_0009g425 [Ancylostoma ceylanicum]